jgi:MoaA/NifB/PqqE/SkfB family radical SAM enzyme
MLIMEAKADCDESKKCSCSCPCERGVRFLARHSWARRAFARFGRGKAADWLMGFLARRLAGRSRKAPGGIRAALDHYIGDDSPAAAEGAEDLDCEFYRTFTVDPENREGLAKFLESLDSLDPGVCRGLMKTWLHTAVFSASIRRATFLCNHSGDAPRFSPMDAIVAHCGRCNLQCRGCYASNEPDGASASPSRLEYVVEQLDRMNVFHVLFVGKGEPFYDEQSKRSMFEVVRRHPRMFFSVYSNGTNISADDVRRLKSLPNLFPVLSIDGPEAVNDRRRGPGVHRKAIETFRVMRREGLLFGFISTVFLENRDAVLDPVFIGQMASSGCRLGLYSLFVSPEHAPCREMMLNAEQRERYFADLRGLRAASAIPLIDIDALEAGFGCRARRGATIYIDAVTGRVSPCVRSPYSPDSCNIYQPAHRDRLAEIVDSPYFRDYRRQSAVLPCDAFQRAECGAGCSQPPRAV